MTDGSTEGGEPGPDRSAARRFRVVGFDDLADAEAPRPVRIAAFDAVGTPDTGSPPSRSASFDDLGTRGPRRAVEDRPTTARTARRAGRRAAAGGEADPADAGPATPSGRGRRIAGAAAVPGGGDVDGDVTGVDADGIPPDAPLPRGRRRARVGRLGPDAPDPDEPTPDADPVAVAREICLRLLTDRARTRQELTQALARRGVAADVSATVLDRFDEVGLIDDAAFAEQWVRSRHAHRGLGRRAIAVELRRKGVADDVAREALADVDAEAERGRARELVDRKLRSLTVGTAEQRVVAARRLVGMLARKGYGAGTAYDVVREALAAHGAETDELGPVELPE